VEDAIELEEGVIVGQEVVVVTTSVRVVVDVAVVVVPT